MNSMQQPFISIIIPTYNREAFLHKTITSFMQQTFTDFELLLVDDGGNDNSKQVAASFNDSRVKYYWKENGERGAARNYGAALAKGSYLNFFDSDDIAFTNHLQAGYSLLHDSGTEPALAFAGFEFADQQGKIISIVNNFKGNVVTDIINRNKRNLNSVFIKKEIFDEIKFEENRLMAASEDTLLLCRLVARHTPVFKNAITSAMIEHNNRSMVTASEAQLLNRRQYLLAGLQQDAVFMAKYSSNLKVINGEMAYLLCLSCLAAGHNAKAFAYFKESVNSSATSFFSRRLFVFIKKSLFNFFK